MSYQTYITNKSNYLYLNNQIGGNDKKKKCTIDNTDKILFGDGGSTSIIIISKNKKVYKIFTLYINDLN